MFDWNDARYFLAIWRGGSLSAAGRQLRVQQTTVGRRLQALEAALHARLFERTPDGYVPTPAGEALVARAERMEEEALSAERELLGREGLVAGTVRVTAPLAFGFSFVVPLLARLRREQPDIVVEVVADNSQLSLSRREADLALRMGRPSQPQLIMRKLGAVANGLYASRAYLQERGPVRGGDLTGHDYVGWDETYSHAPSLAAFVQQRHRGGRCALKVNGTPAALEAARAGLGVALLPCWLADADESLARVMPDAAQQLDLWLVMHKDLRHAARIRVVADFFVRQIAAEERRLLGAAPARARRTRSGSPRSSRS
jgi:DNA-binding transcriptional LysR family regulator